MYVCMYVCMHVVGLVGVSRRMDMQTYLACRECLRTIHGLRGKGFCTVKHQLVHGIIICLSSTVSKIYRILPDGRFCNLLTAIPLRDTSYNARETSIETLLS